MANGPDEVVPEYRTLKLGIYRHYKGDKYLVLGLGQHTETNEKLVVYVPLSATHPGPRIRCRPLAMFLGNNEEGVMRFQYLGQEL